MSKDEIKITGKCDHCGGEITVDIMAKYDATSCNHLAILMRKLDKRVKVYLRDEQESGHDWEAFRKSLLDEKHDNIRFEEEH
jgi:hypothetical protein